MSRRLGIMGSGSGLERRARCPGSAHLPSAPDTNEASAQGTANHEREEVAIDLGGVKSPVVELALRGSNVHQTEVAYAVDVETGTARQIGAKLGRNYGDLSPTEIPLTVDLVCLDTSAVWDWKSRKRVADPTENYQLRLAGYAAAKVNGWDSVTVGIGYLSDNAHAVGTMTSLDMDVLLADLRAIYAGLKAAEASPASHLATGPWCEYCPAMAWCPAQTNLARAMVGELEAAVGQIEQWTPEAVGRAHVKLKAFEDLAERVKKAIRLRAQREFIPLPGGKKVLAMSEQSRTSYDAHAMAERLSDLGEDPKKYMKTTHFAKLMEKKA